jgi:hypothetical protein
MPVRAALNIAYAILVDGLDSKQREEFDTDLHGWGDLNDVGNRILHTAIEDDAGG